MKTNFFTFAAIMILITSCTPDVPRPQIDVTTTMPATVTFTAVPTMQELVLTATPTATPTATTTITPSQTPVKCVRLLTPPNGAEIPAVGKVTFAWDPVDKAIFYVLNIIQPSGVPAPFVTRETSRGQFMEAFAAGGQFHWEVILQDRKRREICRSELFTFNKPASDLRQPPGDDGKK